MIPWRRWGRVSYEKPGMHSDIAPAAGPRYALARWITLCLTTAVTAFMPRQKIIGYFFAALAASGFALYWLLPEGSELRLLGIVLMIFCLPLVMRQVLRREKTAAPRPAPRAAEPTATFAPREVNLTLEAKFSQIVATNLMLADGDILDLPCLLALGSDGFRSRLWRADKITGPWPNDETLILNAEFLMPERALPRFPVDTIARVLVGTAVIGNVKVLRNHADHTAAPTNLA